MKKQKKLPLIIESYPTDYNGYPFITLIQYRKEHLLTIVNNSNEDEIGCFVLSLCGAEAVNEDLIIDVASEWYNSTQKYPISIEFSKKRLTSESSKIFRTFPTEYITRIIGPVPNYPMKQYNIRRRRKKLPEGIEIKKSNVVKIR